MRDTKEKGVREMTETNPTATTTMPASGASQTPRHPFPSAAKPPAAPMVSEAKPEVSKPAEAITATAPNPKPVEPVHKERIEMAEAKQEVKKPAAKPSELQAALQKKWLAARERDDNEANKRKSRQVEIFEGVRDFLVSDLNSGLSLAKLYARFKEVAGPDVMSQKVFQAEIVLIVKDKDSGVSKDVRRDILERVEAAKASAKKRKDNKADAKPDEQKPVSVEKPVQ